MLGDGYFQHGRWRHRCKPWWNCEITYEPLGVKAGIILNSNHGSTVMLPQALVVETLCAEAFGTSSHGSLKLAALFKEAGSPQTASSTS